MTLSINHVPGTFLSHSWAKLLKRYATNATTKNWNTYMPLVAEDFLQDTTLPHIEQLAPTIISTPQTLEGLHTYTTGCRTTCTTTR